MTRTSATPLLDLPAAPAALQDQIDHLVAVSRAQQRTIDALSSAPRRPHPDGPR